ncbi:hypothetical protein FACS1894184_14000 [Clostridia bacterium]|nr:hypothetical protein FACS1894184_14000 [Clostridia bacterium]
MPLTLIKPTTPEPAQVTRHWVVIDVEPEPTDRDEPTIDAQLLDLAVRIHDYGKLIHGTVLAGGRASDLHRVCIEARRLIAELNNGYKAMEVKGYIETNTH